MLLVHVSGSKRITKNFLSVVVHVLAGLLANVGR